VALNGLTKLRAHYAACYDADRQSAASQFTHLPPAALDRSIDAILAAFSTGPFIFNLGRGVPPETPLAPSRRGGRFS